MSEWKRVKKSRPCPICGKPDFCVYSGPDDAPEAVLCPRVEEGSKGWKGSDGGGYLHVLRREEFRSHLRERPRAKSRPPADEPPKLEFVRIAERAENTVSPERLAAFADDLGLSVDSLRRLRVGWSGEHNAWTFPMRDPFGNVCGIRLRLASGRKLSVKGGKEGLFVPDGLSVEGELLVVCEGPTDCAALLDMGLEAVGRPSCTGGLNKLHWLAAIVKPREVLILHDRDEPGSAAERATTAGAQRLADVLAAPARTVRIARPPEGVKDVRAWRGSGAGMDDVMALMDQAEPRRRGRHDWMRNALRSEVA